MEPWNPTDTAQWTDEPAAAAPATTIAAPAPAYTNPDDWASEVQGEWANTAATAATTVQPAQANWGGGSSDWH